MRLYGGLALLDENIAFLLDLDQLEPEVVENNLKSSCNHPGAISIRISSTCTAASVR